ncbi:MAG: SAM-dependent methyltransferase [Bradymonadia bacterium]|jgi:SAM-dependent methyltransferase
MRGASWEVRGLEPDPDFAAAGQKAYQVAIDAALHEDVVYEPGAFDLIASFHVLEHVLSPTAFLRKINTELAEGGHLFVEVPSIERPYGGNLDRFFWSAHLTSFSTNSLGAFLMKAGFDVVWQGFEGDFIQAIARKSDEQTPSLPVDSPVTRWAGVKAKGLAYRSLRQSVIAPLTKSVKDGGTLVAELIAPASRSKTASALHRDFDRRRIRQAGAPEIIQFCDLVPSPIEIAFRAAVDASGACAWTTADRHSLAPEINVGKAAIVLGPTRWTLGELEYWGAQLAHSDASAVWVPAAEFDEQCVTDRARWIDAILKLARGATLGVSDPDHHSQLSDAGVPCIFDPSPLMAAAMAHGESTARSRIIGLSVRLPIAVHESQRLEELALRLGDVRGHRIRVLLIESADAEIVPWLHGVGTTPEVRRLYGRALEAALKEIAGLALLVTNRSDLAEAARVVGVPALNLDFQPDELRDALTRTPSPIRSVAVSTLATVLARSVRSLR